MVIVADVAQLIITLPGAHLKQNVLDSDYLNLTGTEAATIGVL